MGKRVGVVDRSISRAPTVADKAFPTRHGYTMHDVGGRCYRGRPQTIRAVTQFRNAEELARYGDAVVTVHHHASAPLTYGVRHEAMLRHTTVSMPHVRGLCRFEFLVWSPRSSGRRLSATEQLAETRVVAASVSKAVDTLLLRGVTINNFQKMQDEGHPPALYVERFHPETRAYDAVHMRVHPDAHDQRDPQSDVIAVLAAFACLRVFEKIHGDEPYGHQFFQEALRDVHADMGRLGRDMARNGAWPERFAGISPRQALETYLNHAAAFVAS